jgi:hypothetical protein
MIDSNHPITKKNIDLKFLETLLVLGKTYGGKGNYTEVKDFIDFSFKLANQSPPSEKDYEPFED